MHKLKEAKIIKLFRFATFEFRCQKSVYLLLDESSFVFRMKLPKRLNTLDFFCESGFSGCNFSESLVGVRGSSSTGFCFFGVKLPHALHFSFSANEKKIMKNQNKKPKFKNIFFENCSLLSQIAYNRTSQTLWKRIETIEIEMKTELKFCMKWKLFDIMQTIWIKRALVLIWQKFAVGSSAAIF